jgi:hypothetical protein
MLTQPAVRLALVLALAQAPQAFAADPKPACPEGQTMSGGKCVTACPTTGAFQQPDDCECPSGFGKILTGDGNGLCDRLRCPTNSPFESTRACDCPSNFEKSKPKKGQVSCVLKKSSPPPKTK